MTDRQTAVIFPLIQLERTEVSLLRLGLKWIVWKKIPGELLTNARHDPMYKRRFTQMRAQVFVVSQARQQKEENDNMSFFFLLLSF